MPRRLRSSIRPKEEATTQQLSLPLTENHTRASSGANEPQKRKRSHDTPTRLSEQPARKRRAGKKENAKAKKKITDFPHEVILNIITKLDFSRDDFMKMRLAIRTFNELLMAHRTTIINDIAAQQFPFVSLLVLRIAPTVQWLVNVKDLEDKTEQFLSACTRRLKRYSAQFKALADPHYKMIAQVGLHVIAAQRVLIEDELEDLEWFYLPERFPDTLVLCISFAGAIVAQAAECFFQDAPYQDRNERFRRTSDSLLCTDGWDGMWAFLVGPSLKLKGDTAKLTRESGKVWGREFRTFLGLVDMDDEHYDEHDEEKAMDAGSVGLRLKIKVEELVGEHATREMLDLAVIEALEESKFSLESFTFRPLLPHSSPLPPPSPTWLRDLAFEQHGARTLVDICLKRSPVAAKAVEVLGEKTWRTIATLGLHLANWQPPPRPHMTIRRQSFINTMPLALVYVMRLACAMLADTLSSSNVPDWTISGFSYMKDYMDDLQFYTEHWLYTQGWSSFEVLLAPRTMSLDSRKRRCTWPNLGGTSNAQTS